MKSLKLLNGLSLDQVKAERCRRSFYYFFKEFWPTIEAVELVDNWHIKYICNHLQEVYETWERGEGQPDVYLNVPPGSSKSTICTQLFPVWLWVRNQSIRIITSSYSNDLSTAHAVKSKDCIRSDKFKLYFSDVVDLKSGEDNKTWYKNSKKGERYSTSTGGTVTGIHADFIIVDDPINVKKSESKTERVSASKHLNETLSTRKTDRVRSVTIVIMQRLHEDDPTGLALKNKRDSIKHICLPAEYSDLISPEDAKQYYTDGLLDVNRLSREALAKLKQDLGSYGYAGQMDQNPSPEGGGQIKKAWFRVISYEEFKAMNPTINFFLDTAYTANQQNDPTALMAASSINNNVYILNSEQVWKELPDLIKYIPSYASSYGYSNRSKIMIEPKASGKSTVQSFRNTPYNVLELPPPLDDKITRVSNVSPFIEAGRCYIVEGGWNDSFLDECGHFPNGSHDDQVDNLVNAINYYENTKSSSRSSVF